MRIVSGLARTLVKRPKTVIILYTIVTLLVGLQVRNLYMQSDLATFLPEDDPTLLLWEKINQEFQIGSTIIVYVEADDIRDPYVLREMDRVGTKLNTYELDKGLTDGIFSVTSVAQLIKQENAKPPLPGGLGGTGRYEIPTDPSLITTYFARIQATSGILFLNTYKVAVIVFQLGENADYSQVIQNVKAAIAKEARYADMTVTGGIAMQEAIRGETLQALSIVFPLAALSVSIALFFLHRTLKGLVIGFLPLGYALLLTFGVLGAVQPELTILTVAVAALLLGLGVDYSIYLANRFAEERLVEDKVKRVELTLRQTGKAVMLCALTTMIGFSSLMTSHMPPMVTFGFACAIGIFFTFISAVILVPCLCILFKFEKHDVHVEWRRFAGFLVDNRKRLFVVACFFVILSLIVLPQVKTDVNVLEMAPEGIPEVDKLFEYSDNFGGGTNFNALLVETDSQGLTYPEVINAIYSMEEDIRATGAQAYSIADELKKINDILERSLIIEKISELVGVDTIILDRIARQGLIDDQFSKTIIIVSFPVGIGIQQLEQIIRDINDIAANAVIPQNGVVSSLVGQDVVTVEINKQIMSSQTISLLIALLLVLACLIVSFNSIGIGFLALVPVLIVIAWEPGALVMLNIPLSIINITVASIMIGTGLDYSIQTTQRVREEIGRGVPKIDAVKKTLETTGWSLLSAAITTTSALIATFFIDIHSLHQFSIVVITLIVFSLIASICVLPLLLTSRFIK